VLWGCFQYGKRTWLKRGSDILGIAKGETKSLKTFGCV
jgi:hypothetical protein